MARKSQSEVIAETGVMVQGIRQNQDVLSKRGIDTTFADNLQENIDKCVTLNQEQETLKAQLKSKTEELNIAFAEMEKKSATARKIIKIDIRQSLWKEFGIADKK